MNGGRCPHGGPDSHSSRIDRSSKSSASKSCTPAIEKQLWNLVAESYPHLCWYLPKKKKKKKQLLGTGSDTVHTRTRGGVRRRYEGQETSGTRGGKKTLRQVPLPTSPKGGLAFGLEEKRGNRSWE